MGTTTPGIGLAHDRREILGGEWGELVESFGGNAQVFRAHHTVNKTHRKIEAVRVAQQACESFC
jgi:hypothetical protein